MFIHIAQIIVSVLLIVAVLLQQRGTALGSAFGQEGGSFYAARRGLEKKIFWATVILGILFVLLAFLDLLV